MTAHAAQIKSPLLLIACGALAHEVMAVLRLNDLHGVAVQCLPARLHNTPQLIPDAVRAKIREGRARYERIFVLYGDCGTGGLLDEVLEEEGVERIAGAHCYEFFATARVFAQLADHEPGTFYLTDFLLRHFERLVVRPLGLDRHPELTQEYFRNYRKLVYLSQAVPRPEAIEQAQRIAARFGFEFEHRFTGYGELGTRLAALVESQDTLAWPA